MIRGDIILDRNDYNIDDILSEVKKRKEGAEHAQEETPPKKEAAEENAAEEAPSDDATETAEPAEPEKTAQEAPEAEAEPVAKAPAEPEEAEENDESQAEDGEAEEMVNLMALAEEDGDGFSLSEESAEDSAAEVVQPEEAKKKKPKSKTKKILTAVIVTLLVLILAAGAVFAITANDWINEIIHNSTDDSETTVTTTEWQGMKKLVENFDPIQETEATELASLEDMIKTWYHNGTPCSSTHVLNVLLIGEDTRGDKLLEEGTRADSAIIVSVNVDTGKITLTSILRDAWAYWETDFGNEETGQFGKINGAMSLGDIKVYKHTIEQLYKIKLDGHAIVNFDSFKSIVDALGGVELELTAAEITEINSHPKTYGDVWITKKFEGDKGVQKLNGRQALAYCRIRHIDSDGARADRQKTCLVKIFEQTKGASTTKMLKIIKKLIPYVKTSFGKNDIIKIATYALSEGWLDYETETTNVPEMNLKGGNFKPEYGSQWIWKADFPADAYMVQKRIYGKTSITLAHVRVDTKTVKQTGIFADGARATTDTYVNENYGEESTLPPTTDEDKQ